LFPFPAWNWKQKSDDERSVRFHRRKFARIAAARELGCEEIWRLAEERIIRE
jgi:hypothetical protein